MNKNDMQEGCWNSIRGSITREVDDDGKRWTIIRLGGRNLDGNMMGQCLQIESRRLERPGMLKKVLDNMSLDLRRYDLV